MCSAGIWNLILPVLSGWMYNQTNHATNPFTHVRNITNPICCDGDGPFLPNQPQSDSAPSKGPHPYTIRISLRRTAYTQAEMTDYPSGISDTLFINAIDGDFHGVFIFFGRLLHVFIFV